MQPRSLGLIAGIGLIAGMCCVAIFVCSVLSCCGGSVEAAGSGVQGRPRVYVVIVDQLTWDDLLEPGFPAFARLADGAIGLMNTVTGGMTNPENEAVTLGASGRGVGTATAGQVFDTTTWLRLAGSASSLLSTLEQYELEQAGPGGPLEPRELARTVYERRTGNAVAAGVVNLSIAEIDEANRALRYIVSPGALGTALREAGIAAAYLGNGDTLAPRRHLSCILMDSQGTIQLGSVEGLTVADSSRPYGKKTDYEGLLGHLDSLSSSVRLVAIELSDLVRLYESSNLYSAAEFGRIRKSALGDIDSFIFRLLQLMDRSDELLLLVPTPPRHRISANDTFTPIAMLGGSIGRGWLSSQSTRRPGIVTNLDFAPTVLSALDVQIPDTMYGHPMSVASVGGGGASDLESLHHRISSVNLQRRTILRTLVIANIIIYIGILGVLLVPRIPDFAWLMLRLLIPFMMSMPLALLLLPLLQINGVLQATIAMLLMSAAITGLASALSRSYMAVIALIYTATALALVVDTLTGNRLVAGSILGYDPMGGARFYGIGNEYMGVLVGTSALATAAWMSIAPTSRRAVKILIGGLFILVVVAVSYPGLGANVGGGLTASIGLGLTLVLLVCKRIELKHVIMLLLLSLALLGVNIVVDTLLARGGSSHLGQAISSIGRRGIGEVYSIVGRKLSMNLRLFRYSVWSRALFVALAIIAWSLYRPPRVVRQVQERFPAFLRGVMGATITAVAALMLNDSGVVAGSLALNSVASAVLFAAVCETSGRA